MNEWAAFLALALALALGGCKRRSASPEADADELFLAHCARCHGLKGEGPMYAALPGGGPPPPRNFHDPAFQSGRTDAELRRAIIEGKGPMPPFGKVFDDRELELLVRKIRSFR